MTVHDFLVAALAEVNIVQAGDTPAGDDLDLALLIFNELLDARNADERAVYATVYGTFTLTPNLQPHTIGLAANAPTWTVPAAVGGGASTAGNRPVRIVAANLILNTSTPALYKPLTIRDDAWWMDLRVPGLASSIPTDLMYSADWPNGSVYLWPVPNTAYQIQLDLLTVFAQVSLATVFSLPPGYQQELRLSTAERLAGIFGVPLPPMLPQRAADARALVNSANEDVPRLVTASPGLSGGGGTWDYRTGMVR